MPTEIARTNWNIGVAQLSASRFESAIAVLSDARAELLRLGMPEDAGLAGVDLIEALLATNERVPARELAAMIVDEFRRAGLNERALQACRTCARPRTSRQPPLHIGLVHTFGG